MSDAQHREELAEIAAAARALIEWYGESGAIGLEVSGALPEEGASRAAPRAQTQARAPQAQAPSQASPPRAPQSQGPTSHAAPSHAAPSYAAPRSAPVIEPRVNVDAPASAMVSDDERKTRLALLNEKVRDCEKCGLSKTRTQTVFARGNPFAEVCFVGEGPGADEDAQGYPFVGKAGQLLDRMIAAMGYARDDVYICNVVKCRPPDNRKPEPNEMDACSPYLHEQLALVRPKVIVALGATAVTGLIGSTEGITRMRGKWKLYKGQTPIMPTFHPAYLLRQPAAKRDVWDDLQAVMRHVGKHPPSEKKP